MKNYKHLLAALALMLPAPALAQYTIYPVPQEQVAGTGTLSITKEVCIVCEPGIDHATQQRAREVLEEHGLTAVFAEDFAPDRTNLVLGTAGSGGAADQLATSLSLSRDVFARAGKFDRHLLSLSNDNAGNALIVALGEHTDATFFALASLEQILDRGTQELPAVTLYDFADQQSRGLVEGYYGYPYSVEVKKDLMHFMKRYKMNTYLYGAKSDPYHSEKWKDAYPTQLTEQQVKNGWMSQDMIREVSETSALTKVNFIWAIHPGNDFVYSSTVVNDILSKYEKMYALGVRQFAVFVDDVGVPTSAQDLKANADHLTALQRAIEDKWNTEGQTPADTVKPLHFVPQIYCTSFAPSTEVYNNFFQALAATPKYVTIYTTGGGVWSVPNSTDLAAPATQLGRSVAWWWNYPCNDNADSQVFPMDTYTNFYDMPSVWGNATLPADLTGGLGIVSNPMQQGEISKTPLFSVANYAWNHAKFDNLPSWEASFAAVLPGNEAAQAAYRFVAPYLRYNNSAEFRALVTSYKRTGDASDLSALMTELAAQCEVLMGLKDSPVAGEALLYRDLSPWLLKVHTMAVATNRLLATKGAEGNDDSRWTEYLGELKLVDGLDTEEDYKAYALEGMGSAISTSVHIAKVSETDWRPFVTYLKENALGDFFGQEAAPKKAAFAGNVEGVTAAVSTSNNQVAMKQQKACTLGKGQWIGVQLDKPTRVQRIVLQDSVIQNHTFVFSADGKQWTKATEADFVPQGYVRYAGVVNDGDTPVSFKFGTKTMVLHMPKAPQVAEATIPEGNIWDGHGKELMYDGDASTFVCLNRNQQNTDSYTLQLSEKQPIERVRIVMGTVNGDYMNEGRVQVSANGKNWTSLNVMGTESAAFKMDLPQCVQTSSETKSCLFDGKGIEAQYVRLYLNKANTSKWLRLYEIEVNGEGAFTQGRMEDEAKAVYNEVWDGLPYTGTAQAAAVGNEGCLTYYCQNYRLLKGLTLYCDPQTMAGVEAELTTDGTNWTALPFDAETGVVRLQFSAGQEAAKALRFKWTGAQAPAIYEVVEVADEAQRPVVSRIEEVGAQAGAAQATLKVLSRGRLQAEAAAGLRRVEVFDTAGRCLTTLSLAGARTATVPVTRTAGETLVVRLVLADGSAVSYKVQ